MRSRCRAGFPETVFVTENRAHVLAARQLGMTAVHVKGPSYTTGDITPLPELVPIVRGPGAAGVVTDL